MHTWKFAFIDVNKIIVIKQREIITHTHKKHIFFLQLRKLYESFPFQRVINFNF